MRQAVPADQEDRVVTAETGAPVGLEAPVVLAVQVDPRAQGLLVDLLRLASLQHRPVPTRL